LRISFFKYFGNVYIVSTHLALMRTKTNQCIMQRFVKTVYWIVYSFEN